MNRSAFITGNELGELRTAHREFAKGGAAPHDLELLELANTLGLIRADLTEAAEAALDAFMRHQ